MSETAIIIGVGSRAGVGAAVTARFAAEGMHVVLAGRTEARLQDRAEEIRQAGGEATVCPTDVRKEEAIVALFDAAQGVGNPLRSVVFNPGANVRHSLAETEAWLFEHLWRVASFGGFLVARECARRMPQQGGGSVLFTGATGSLRGAAGHAAFAAAKSGARMVVQSLAREYGPQGIHAAHVIIDGVVNGEAVTRGLPGVLEQLGEDAAMDVDAIAANFWHLHTQPRSAWSFEVDLRPFVETF
jgi:NAD(P)-dependent dehydrogenase (short-subunit alcohol dehydrogenase family)